MRRITSLFMLTALLFGSTVLSVAAQEATPGAAPAGDSLLSDLGYPELHVTSDGTTHDFPTEVEAGRYHVVLENQSELDIDLEFYQLPEGVTIDDLMAAFAQAESGPGFVPPDFFYDMVFNGGPTTFPGETYGVVLDLMPGEWVVNLYTYDPATDETTNTPTTVTVTGEMPALEDPTGHVEIGLVEMEFVVPDTFTAGPQVWHVTNNGLQVHHLVLSRVPEGTTEDQVIELATSFLAPPASPEAVASPADTALSFEDIQDVFYTLLFSEGQFNLYELDLEPGTYAMICFMPDPSGTPHVMLGMVEIVVVE